MAKILVGLSGGVDSSVAAALLIEQGHEVIGAYMKNWINTDNVPGDCPWQDDVDDAYAVAKKLGIEFRVVDLIDQYQERIVDYLLDGYRSGITPNPDVYCNREMKFGVFLDYALEQGFEAVATGHYARKRVREDGTHDILRGADTNKDQSYFLALMEQHQAKYALFPCGEMQKPEVREIATKFDLPTATKKDSQGICFIGNVKMTDFLRHYVPDRPGNIVDHTGKKLGRHKGLHLYTLGQRKGHGVASPREGIAYVVVGKNAARNELIVGYDEAETKDLYTSKCIAGTVSWVNKPLTAKQKIEAQPRYRAKSEPAYVTPIDTDEVGSRFLVEFIHPQRAITPGQICGFYENGVLLGGGVFESLEG